MEIPIKWKGIDHKVILKEISFEQQYDNPVDGIKLKLEKVEE